jgi:superfamily II DNA or RNA helicase
MIKLRDYQLQLIDQLRTFIREGKKRLVMSAPTGAGKTIMFSYMVSEHLKRGGKVLVFTHRTELLKQAGGAFKKFNLKPELITASGKPDLDKPLHVAMVETFNRRQEKYKDFLYTKSLIIIDECHLASFDKLFTYLPENAIVIGATATSYRKGKEIKGLNEMYQEICQVVDTPDLIKDGFLSPAKTFGVQIDLSKAKKKGDDYDTKSIYEETKLYKGVVENYKNICPGTKAILFASNVASSKQVCEEFNINGIIAKHIDGETPTKEREEILQWYDKTPNAIVCNCGILNAGFDQPDIKTVILYRATTSLPLFLQMCGRGSRTHENKTHFNILDFGNNIKRMGFWENARIWGLEKDVKRENKQEAIKTKDCPECNAILPGSVKKCPYCDRQFTKTKEEEENEIIAKLVELTKPQVFSLAKRATLKEKILLVKANKIKASYLLHQMNDIQEARQFIEMLGYKPGWEFYNRDRFKVFQNG